MFITSNPQTLPAVFLWGSWSTSGQKAGASMMVFCFTAPVFLAFGLLMRSEEAMLGANSWVAPKIHGGGGPKCSNPKTDSNLRSSWRFDLDPDLDGYNARPCYPYARNIKMQLH